MRTKMERPIKIGDILTQHGERYRVVECSVTGLCIVESFTSTFKGRKDVHTHSNPSYFKFGWNFEQVEEEPDYKIC